MTVVNVSELFTLKWCILCYVNLISMKKQKGHRSLLSSSRKPAPFTGGKRRLEKRCPLPRPVGGRVADAAGTQVLFLPLQGWSWRVGASGIFRAQASQPSVPGQRSDRPVAAELSPRLCSPAAWLTKMELSSAPSRRPAIAPACCRASLPSVPRASSWTSCSPSTERPSTRTRWSWPPAATTSGEPRSRGTGWRAPTLLRGSVISVPASQHVAEGKWPALATHSVNL